MENFKDELQLMTEKKAVIQVDSYSALEKQLANLLDDKKHRESLKNNCRGLVHNAEEILEAYSALILKEN